MNPLHKILHIDDDAMMRMMVKKSFERSEYPFEVITCATATEFKGALTSFSPDLLVIDVVMPSLNGPDLLEIIRAESFHMPAVFMTGHDSLDFPNREKLEPILGMIRKPFSPTSLAKNLLDMWNNSHQVSYK